MYIWLPIVSGCCKNTINECDIKAKTKCIGVDLSCADLQGSNLEEANLERANLTDANLLILSSVRRGGRGVEVVKPRPPLPFIGHQR